MNIRSLADMTLRGGITDKKIFGINPMFILMSILFLLVMILMIVIMEKLKPIS